MRGHIKETPHLTGHDSRARARHRRAQERPTEERDRRRGFFHVLARPIVLPRERTLHCCEPKPSPALTRARHHRRPMRFWPRSRKEWVQTAMLTWLASTTRSLRRAQRCLAPPHSQGTSQVAPPCAVRLSSIVVCKSMRESIFSWSRASCHTHLHPLHFIIKSP